MLKFSKAEFLKQNKGGQWPPLPTFYIFVGAVIDRLHFNKAQPLINTIKSTLLLNKALL
jgi:hypothetical protein